MDPLPLFFALGLLARVARSDLRVPEALYEALSLVLLLSIGLKGGVELARQPVATYLPHILAALLLGFTLPLVAYPVLRRVGRMGVADAASIAAHYGSVSVVTFAAARAFMERRGWAVEGVLTLMLVLMEVPGILCGIVLARRFGSEDPGARARDWLVELLTGRSVVLLLGGLAIGWLSGEQKLAPAGVLFFGLFKGLLAVFLLEMGLVVGGRLRTLREAGPFLVAFGVGMPLVGASLGLCAGSLLHLSKGGAAVLATLCASASYIAAPAALRVAVPSANPALSLGAALGITFPFNLLVGIPLYAAAAERFFAR